MNVVASRRQVLRVHLPIFFVLSLIALTAVYPIFFMALNTLKGGSEYFRNVYGLPHAVTFGNYTHIVRDYHILRSLWNSVWVGGVSTVVSTSLAALASFALAKFSFRGQRLIWAVTISMLLIPGQVLIIPIYLMFSHVGLVNNYLSVILIFVVRALPFGIFLLTATFRAIPRELVESARVDGSSLLRTFRDVIVPLGRPALMTLSVLSFLTMWNDLLLPFLLLPGEKQRLLTPQLATIGGQYITNEPLVLTGLLFNALPPIIVLAFLSKYLVRGITVGLGK